jgi:hypothetical protein
MWTTGDAHWYLWWLWWVNTAVREGKNPCFTDRLLYPTGAPLYLAADLTSAAVSLPLQAAFGLVTAYNLTLLLALLFSAWAMYRLAYRTTGSREGALVAGAIFAFSPLMISAASSAGLALVNAGFMLLSVAFLLELDGGRLLTAVLAACAIAAATFTTFYQTLFLTLFAALLFCWKLVGLGAGGEWDRLLSFARRLAVSAALALLLVAPILVPALRLASRNNLAQLPREWVASFSAGALEPFRPNALSPFFGHGKGHPPLSLGYVPLLLALLGAWHSRRRGAFWGVVALVFYLLSLGPVLKVGQHRWDLWFLPYNLLYATPLGKIPRTPFLFLIVVSMALAVLASWGVVWLRQQVHALAGGRAAAAATIVALTLVLVEWFPTPRPVAAMAVPPFYTALAHGPSGALLEVPPVQASAFYAQTVHGRPIVGGYVGRPTEEALRNLEVPFVRQMWLGSDDALRELTDPDVFEGPTALAHAAELLDAYGIRYVVLHKTWGRWVALRPLLDQAFPAEMLSWDDAEIRAYRIPASPPGGREPGVVMGLGPGWNPPEMAAGRLIRWAEQSGTVALFLLDAKPRTVRFVAWVAGYRDTRRLEARLNGQLVTTGSSSPDGGRLSFDVPLVPGHNALTLTASGTPLEAGDGRRLSFAIGRVRVEDGREGASP